MTIEIDREDDGRWLAEVMELPGAMAYGDSREEAERPEQRRSRSEPSPTASTTARTCPTSRHLFSMAA